MRRLSLSLMGIVLLISSLPVLGSIISEEHKIDIAYCTYQSLNYPYVIVSSFEENHTNVYLQNVEANTLEKITTNSVAVRNPVGDGNYIVWSERVKPNSKKRNDDVKIYDMTKKQIVFTSNRPGYESNAIIKGNLVAWIETELPIKSSVTPSLKIYDIGTGITDTILENFSEVITGTTFVGTKLFWISNFNSSDYRTKKGNVACYDPETHKVTWITDSDSIKANLYACNNWVFWFEFVVSVPAKFILKGYNVDTNTTFEIENSDLAPIPAALAMDPSNTNLVYVAYSYKDDNYGFYHIDLSCVNGQHDIVKIKILTSNNAARNMFYENNNLLWQWDAGIKKPLSGIMHMDTKLKTNALLLEDRIIYLNEFDGNIILCSSFKDEKPIASYFILAK